MLGTLQPLINTGVTSASPTHASALGVNSQLTTCQQAVAADAATLTGCATLAFSSESGISADIYQDQEDIQADNDGLATRKQKSP